ncbi:unnamed protein product [Lasius platythorax]|uniref:Uncharacterized protein n=1 Tax=Lasius platythorax TaxID=488582 RepID=A0AAV2NYC2_9HYME
MGVYLVESWWLNGMVPSLCEDRGFLQGKSTPCGRQRRTSLNPLGHVYIFPPPYIRLQFLFPPPFLIPGAAMPRDLPCPSSNLTGLGSPEARNENITSLRRKMEKNENSFSLISI